jgi:hypothetical protein
MVKTTSALQQNQGNNYHLTHKHASKLSLFANNPNSGQVQEMISGWFLYCRIFWPYP